MPAPGRGQIVGGYRIDAVLPGDRTGHYYRAFDLHLQREITLRVLPGPWTAARRKRLERLTRLLASLSHPHIAAIHGFVEADGLGGIVLEPVDGRTLASQLAHGPLAIPVVLRMAAQIADALEAAHDRGLAHGGLEPESILIRCTAPDSPPHPDQPAPGTDVTVTIVDFGVAADDEGGASSTAGRTRRRAVNTQNDIRAFGCVLYAMLTGMRLDPAGTSPAGGSDPDWSTLPPETPEPIRRLLRRCLQDDPRRRLRDIGDARLEIEAAMQDRSGARISVQPSDAPAPSSAAGAPRASGVVRRRVVVAVAALVPLAAAAASWLWIPRPAASRAVVQAPSTAELPTRLTFDGGLQTDPAISPDGRFVAYASNRNGNFDLWVQSVSGGIPVQVTTDPAPDWQADWSPDGASLVFRSEREGGGLFVVSAFGGDPQRISVEGSRPQWSPDGRLVAYSEVGAAKRRLLVTPASGQGARTLFEQRAEAASAWGWHPSGKLSVLEETGGPRLELRLELLDPAGGPAIVITGGGQAAGASPLGVTGPRLAWDQSGTTMFFGSVARGQIRIWRASLDQSAHAIGAPSPLATLDEAGIGPSISANGRMLALSVASRTSRLWAFRLLPGGLIERSQPIPVEQQPAAIDPPSTYMAMADRVQPDRAVSPDGRWVAVAAATVDGPSQIAVTRVGTESSRILAAGRGGGCPRWSSDGRQLYFTSRRNGALNLWAMSFDPRTGRTGTPFQVTAFDGLAEALDDASLSRRLSVDASQLVVPVVQQQGGVWLVRTLGR